MSPVSIPTFTWWYPSGAVLKTNEISLACEIIIPAQANQKKQTVNFARKSKSLKKRIN